jgi:hypothetical protein
MSWVTIDVDIDDIIYDMSKYDRKVFFNKMKDEGYISHSCIITNDGEVKALPHIERNTLNESQDEFNQALQKLFGNGWKLTKEQEDYIINLSKRF